MPLSREALDGLRCCVRPEYAGLAAEDLHSIIDASISGLPGDAGEDFLSTLGSIGKAVGPALQAAAPDAASGAAAGSAFGPWGTLIGAGAGLTSSLIKSQTKTAPRPVAPAATAPARVAAVPPAAQAPPAAPAVAGTPAAGVPTAAPPSLPTGQGAAATLLSLFQNPTVQQAVLSQALGSSGTQEVPTPAGQSIPRGAINALLSQLLTKASDGLPEAESISDQSYLQGEDGAYLIDPASFDQQAALVLHYLQRKASARMQEPMEWISEGSSEITSEEWPEFDQISEEVTFY